MSVHDLMSFGVAVIDDGVPAAPMCVGLLDGFAACDADRVFALGDVLDDELSCAVQGKVLIYTV
jgi:hypothetical protein